MTKLTQDKVIDVLRGKKVGKRAPRFGTLDLYLREGGYLIQVGGRTLVDQAGTVEEAKADAHARAESMSKKLGMPVSVNIY